SDRGDWGEALTRSHEAATKAAEIDPVVMGAEARIDVLTVEIAAGRKPKDELVSLVRDELAFLDANADKLDAVLPRVRASAVQALGVLAARLDDAELAQACRDRVERIAAVDGYPLLAQVRTVLEAELERISETRGPATLKLRDMARSEDALV